MSELSELPADINLRNCFMVEWQGTAIKREGYARLHAALEGIQAVNALMFQAAVDKDCTGGIALHPHVIIGLTSAISVCADYAQNIIDGDGCNSKAIKSDSPEYATLEKLAAR